MPVMDSISEDDIALDVGTKRDGPRGNAATTSASEGMVREIKRNRRSKAMRNHWSWY
jgi:hypothetical protein